MNHQRLNPASLWLLPVGLVIAALLTPAAAQQREPSAQMEQQVQVLSQLALSSSAEDFRRSSEQQLAVLSPRQRSELLRELLLTLRKSPPTPAGQWLVSWVSQSPAAYSEPHPERPALAHDPLGLSAIAQGTANHWTWQDWRDRIISQGKSGQWTGLDQLTELARSADPADRAAVAGAATGLSQLDPTALNHRDLRKALITEPALAPLTLKAVKASGDAVLLQQAMANWPAAAQHTVVLTLDRWLSLAQAVDLWLPLAQQSTMGSTADSTAGPGVDSSVDSGAGSRLSSGHSSGAARNALQRVLNSGQLTPATSQRVQAALEQRP